MKPKRKKVMFSAKEWGQIRGKGSWARLKRSLDDTFPRLRSSLKCVKREGV